MVNNLDNRVGPVQIGNTRKFRFTRSLDTGDAMDLAIVAGGAPILVGVAVGTSDAHLVHAATDSQSVVFATNASSGGGSGFHPTLYQHNVTVVKGSVYFYWTVFGDQISMALQVAADGWVALGVTPGTGGGMQNCDVVTGYQQVGVWTVIGVCIVFVVCEGSCVTSLRAIVVLLFLFFAAAAVVVVTGYQQVGGGPVIGVYCVCGV